MCLIVEMTCDFTFTRNSNTPRLYIANGKKSCYIVQQFHWANKRDVTLRHL